LNVPAEQVQQAPTVRVPKRFPLVAKPGFRSTTLKLSDPTVTSPVSDSILINAYAELDPEDNEYWVEKRLGNVTLTTQTGNAGGVGVGYTSASGPLALPVAIFGANLYVWRGAGLVNVPYTGTHAQPLIQGRLANFLSLPLSVANANLLWAANGGMWLAVLEPGHFPLPVYGYSAAADFITGTGGVPWTLPLCDGMAYLDEVAYVMDQGGNIWGSNQDDITTWPATTVILAGGRNDFPVVLAQQLEYIIAFKSTSFRCFYDAGSAAQTSGVGSNLAWVEGADGNFGCANAGSMQLIDQTLVWVTNNLEGTAQVARMDGLQVQIISTPPVERLLQQLTMAAYSAAPNAVNNILYSNCIKRGGHRFYTLTAKTVRTGGVPFTLVYDLDQQLWYIWTSPGKTYWSVVGAAADSDDETAGVFAQDISGGQLYLTDIDQIYPTDSGVTPQVDIYTPTADMGTRRRKQLSGMYFVNNQVSGSKMQVRFTNTDYRKWSPFRNVSLDNPNPFLSRCGTFRKRALNLRHTLPTPFRIKAADCAVDIGTL
jgi:hypothetical protein